MSDAPKPAPREGGPADHFLAERASHTPLAGSTRASTARRHSAARAVAPLSLPLRQLQLWFAAVITDPRSVAHGVSTARRSTPAERIVTRGPQLSAHERLGIYHYAYHARLCECLADDFPAVQAAVGVTAFTRLARAYINAHPSHHPNLNGFGAGFPAFLRTEAPRIARRTAIADLARLEWALVEVLHAQAAPTFDVAALQRIGIDRWATMRLRPSATVHVLEFSHPINAWFQAWREDRAGALPEKGWSATAIYRQGYRVWRMDLTRPMHAILARLFAGKSLGQAIDAAVRDHGDPQRLIADLQVWFREWVAGGFFAAISDRADRPASRARGRPRRG